MVSVSDQSKVKMPGEMSKAKDGDWQFAQQSVGVAGNKSKSSNWFGFDYFFGPIPDDGQDNHGREPDEEEREPNSTASTPTSRSQPPTEAESMFTSILTWLDPSPSPLPSTTQNVQSAQVQTNPRSGAVEQNRKESKVSKADAPERPSRKEPESVDDSKPLDSVAFAVSEDKAEDNDNTSVVSKASSAVTTQGKMFGDLDSLPSEKGDTLHEAPSLMTADLGGSITKGKDEASTVEEKVKDIKIPTKQPPVPEAASPKKASLTTDTRRQLLLKELQSTVTNFGQYDIRAASISAALGDLFDESQKHDEAIKMHREAIGIYVSKLGDDHSTTLEEKLRLASVLENAKQYDEAITLYYQVTVMRRAIRGEKDPSTADSLSRVATALKKKGDYHPAIKELKRALKIYRESLGDAHEKVSVTVDEIASLYVTLGDFEKASAILEEVVKLKAATKGMKSKPVAATLITLATTYECSEDFNKSMKSLKKAYKIYTDMDGYSSKDATSTLNRIAQLYEAMGDNDRASIAYLGVLRGRKLNYGEDHLKVAETYFKLGHSLRQSGQQEKALKCMKEALPIFVSKGVELEDVEMIAEVMHEMALINKEKHRYAEAARIFKQELGVRRKIGQAEFPMISRTLNHLGVTEYEMKNNNKSLKYLIEALTIYKDHAERSVECAEVLFNTGLVFESSRNKERAMDAYNESARIFREHGYKDSHPHLLKATRKIERLQSQKNGRK